jgi:hypothetical protein
VFEEWSRVKTALFALRAEKTRGEAEIDKAPVKLYPAERVRHG